MFCRCSPQEERRRRRHAPTTSNSDTRSAQLQQAKRRRRRRRLGGCAQDVRLRSALVLHGRRVDEDRIQLNRRNGGILLQKSPRFSQRFLCLSRACLGKMIGCSKVARQKAFFAPPDRSARRARPECTRTCSDHNRTVA
jgi:hypothetical protein